MELTGNEIHLYVSYPEQISEPGLLRRYESLMTADERTQMSRLYFARHRHQFLITRALIRTSLSSYFQVDPADWRFGKNAYGKPQIIFPEKSWPVCFNLSHCEGLVVCAIVRGHDIGVDVEDAQRSTNAALDSLSSYFAAEEIAELAQLPRDHQKTRFFDYWTLKESYIKARGLGLAIPLDKFSFQFKADRLHDFMLDPELGDDAAKWQFWRIPIAGRYRMAVAVNSGTIDFKLRAFQTVPLRTNDAIQLTCL